MHVRIIALGERDPAHVTHPYGERRPVRARGDTRLAEICGTGAFDGFPWCVFGLNPRERGSARGAFVAAARVYANASAARANDAATPAPSC